MDNKNFNFPDDKIFQYITYGIVLAFILFNLESVIESVDGQKLNPIELEKFIKTLPMMDTNFIMQSLKKIKLGVDINFECHCNNCGTDYTSQLPITGEFFGPSED